MVSISLVGGVLLVVTPLADVPIVREGRQVVVVGVTHSRPGDAIIEIRDCRFHESAIYLNTTGDSYSDCDLVVAAALKTTTDTGRTVLESQQTWSFPLRPTFLPACCGIVKPVLLPIGARWLAMAIVGGVILLLIFHWTIAFVRAATLIVVGLTAGTTFAVGLQKIGMLSPQAVLGVIAVTIVTNVLAARFRHRTRRV
jgi:hypothetical protein